MEDTAITDVATFDAWQVEFMTRNPRAAPSRAVTGPILLTGVTTSINCSVTALRTRKYGRYRYYTYSAQIAMIWAVTALSPEPRSDATTAANAVENKPAYATDRRTRPAMSTCGP